MVLNVTDLSIQQNRATGRVGSGMVESMSADDCVFCRVVTGTVESSRVYEDDEVLAFMDIQPVTDGHLLVIPKRHAPHLSDLDEQLGMSMFRVAQRLAAALRNSELPCEGVNLFLADGEVAFQEVFHVHLHVFPRTPGDGFRIDADWRQRPRAELDEAAERIRSGMAASPS
ncbi:HIT family protein [Brachybacterium alimentarium]|uniref:HIT family protein n=1 Tax=Brachybacterium alimentarium TaxID=47845 RepID=UPI003FCF6A3C